MPSVYQLHVNRWMDCDKCELCRGRTQVVLARGKVPCDVLFIGEAPGVSEDVIGRPFVGPAGKLLDQIIEQAWNESSHGWDFPLPLTYAMTNLVACIPLGDDGAKTEEPPKSAIKACAPRLQEFINICSPQLLVLVGNLAAKHAPHDIPSVEIMHPAAILRANVASRDMLVKRAIVTLADAVSVLVE